MTQLRQLTEIDQAVALDAMETVVNEAMRAADLVTAFLRENGMRKGDLVHLPPQILLALANALRMAELSRATDDQVVPPSMPLVTAEQLLQDHLAGTEVEEATSPMAWELVLTKFAHHARRILGADLTQDVTVRDEFVELLADFLWKQRHGHQE